LWPLGHRLETTDNNQGERRKRGATNELNKVTCYLSPFWSQWRRTLSCRSLRVKRLRYYYALHILYFNENIPDLDKVCDIHTASTSNTCQDRRNLIAALVAVTVAEQLTYIGCDVFLPHFLSTMRSTLTLSMALFCIFLSTVAAQGNTTCKTTSLDWYTSTVGETPCL